jgi:hypothetical protein
MAYLRENEIALPIITHPVIVFPENGTWGEVCSLSGDTFRGISGVPGADVMEMNLWIQDEHGIVQVRCKRYPGEVGDQEECGAPGYPEE